MPRNAISYQDKADALRAISEDFADPGAREMMATLANEYELLATEEARAPATPERPLKASRFATATATNPADRRRVEALEAALDKAKTTRHSGGVPCAQKEETEQLTRGFAAPEALVREKANIDAALRDSETRHRLLIESWTQAVWETDAAGAVVTDSPSWRAYTGQTVQEWLGYGWLDAIHPEDRAFAERQWREGVAARGLVNAEFRLRSPDGGWRWTNVRAAPVLGAEETIEKWVGYNIDIEDRKRAEDALRESEERYRALFKSMDEAYAVVDVLKDESGAWVDFRFVEVNPAFISHTSMPWPVGKTATELLGQPNPRWTQLYGQALDTGVPLRTEEPEPTLGRVFDLNIFTLDPARNRVAVLFTNITERKRAEAALRESEERFQQFAKASGAGLWIRDADSLNMEYASPAIATIYGVDKEQLLGDTLRWAALIVPEDRDAALGHVEQARRGESVVHEFRIQRPSDQTFRWIKNTDFPLLDRHGRVQRIGGIAEDVTEAKLALEHQGVLLAELQHRVRNIMAVIQAITIRTAAGASSPEEYAKLLSGRLATLARVQALLTRAANVGVHIEQLVRDELLAQAPGPTQWDIEGPHVVLSPKAAEVLTLAIHELTANAVKYGALSIPSGQVRVRWDLVERKSRSWLVFDWKESGAPANTPSPSPRRRGFGSDLIEGRIPYELGGASSVTIEPGGAQAHLEFPLRDGASILETDAPARATVFGGSIDMTGQADLTGHCILVVEDDYYLAGDAVRALRGAGAKVLGPCATSTDALEAIATGQPTGAFVDIHLGDGASFDVAKALVQRNLPLVFVTGYDPQVIPHELRDAPRLQKPVDLREAVNVLHKTIESRSHNA